MSTSVLLLLRYREGDANVRSVWLCSRNDALGNLAVVVAASGVIATGTGWPDLLVAGIMASLFLYSAISIVRQALGELRSPLRGRYGRASDYVTKSTSCRAEMRMASWMSARSCSRSNSSFSLPAGETQNSARVGVAVLLA